ncbi:hypothetical protein U9M48_044318 [Paspalum notatum var. saurae]|uniref:Uncharacterized protein n=1 Tax=Paspalum notatum var. saurae TaxID=547442 RepID=A0AAQ3UWS9_PASNO
MRRRTRNHPESITLLRRSTDTIMLAADQEAVCLLLFLCLASSSAYTTNPILLFLFGWNCFREAPSWSILSGENTSYFWLRICPSETFFFVFMVFVVSSSRSSFMLRICPMDTVFTFLGPVVTRLRPFTS